MKHSIRRKNKRKQTRKKRSKLSKRGGVYNLIPGGYYRLVRETYMPDGSRIQPTEARFDGMNDGGVYGARQYIVSVNGYPDRGRYYFGVNDDDIDPTQIPILDREILQTDPRDIVRRRAMLRASIEPSRTYAELYRLENQGLRDRNRLNLEEFWVNNQSHAVRYPGYPWFFVPDPAPNDDPISVMDVPKD
jgi:hypothetical protein